MDSKKGETSTTGYTFVSNAMQPYSVGTINADKIYELTENMYVVGILHQLTNLVVQSDVSISVYDDKDDVVEDLSRKLNRMFGTDKCNISSVARSAFQDLVTWGLSIFNWVWEEKNGEIVCVELNHLPPYTFSVSPGNVSEVFTGRLLKGVYYDPKDRSMHYCQTIRSMPTELAEENLFVLKDRVSASPDGNSLILRLLRLLNS